MVPLRMLGGNNGMTLAINDAGQVAGVTEDSTKDSTSKTGRDLDFEAALWRSAGQVQTLRPLPGDTVGFALAMNNSGQVVGGRGPAPNTLVVPLADVPRGLHQSGQRLQNRFATPRFLRVTTRTLSSS